MDTQIWIYAFWVPLPCSLLTKTLPTYAYRETNNDNHGIKFKNCTLQTDDCSVCLWDRLTLYAEDTFLAGISTTGTGTVEGALTPAPALLTHKHCLGSNSMPRNPAT